MLPLLYIIFFFSGAAGLVYQIVWTRMLLVIFGTTTNSVVAVVSAFMAGLALGSFLVPKLFPHVRKRLVLYAALELAIGISALLTPFVFTVVTGIYTSLFSTISGSPTLLILKFTLISLSLLPATIAMGATLPVLVQYVSHAFRKDVGSTVAILYAVNTFGALVGVVATAYVLIEIVGLTGSLVTASFLNISIGILVYIVSRIDKNKLPGETNSIAYREEHRVSYTRDRVRIALMVFSLSGLLSMSYEILWTRMLTPLAGTYIYAFALILTLFLFGIAIGSIITNVLYKKVGPMSGFAYAELGIGIGALLSVLLASDRFSFSSFVTQALVILPGTICMGMTFPFVSRLAKKSRVTSAFVGTSYAFNTIGSMVGPYVAAFFLIVAFGTTRAIVYLSIINIACGMFLLLLEEKKRTWKFQPVVLSGAGALLLFVLFFSSRQNNFITERTMADYFRKFASGGYAYFYKEDETASVLGYSNKDRTDYGLLVDGVGMSVLVDETKLMAHLPILVHPDPKDILVIAFGMGTTFRSALTYDVNVDAVELVPSVPESFSIFFADAQGVRQNPRGRVLINDGRNYVRTTQKRYDVITIDPPPPVNSAGTTVLYAKEFYKQSKRILRPGGIVSQWFFYGTRVDDFQMLVRSFIDVFPYVVALKSPRGIGIYVLGSDEPMKIDKNMFAQKLQAHPAAVADLNEWGQWQGDNLASLYLGDKFLLARFVKDVPAVTDDRPQTEYFLLRHARTPRTIARNEEILIPH